MRRSAWLVSSMLMVLLPQGCSWHGAAIGTGVAVTGLTFVASRMNPLYFGRHASRDSIEQLRAAPFDVRIAYLELDDQGWFYGKERPRAVLDEVSALADSGNVALLVFVHGWRHNLSKGDTDVRAFRETAFALGDLVNDRDFKALRFGASGDSNTTLVGIHVGWRGKMWPEMPVIPSARGKWSKVVNPFVSIANGLGVVASIPVYCTFWSRKSAAERIGHGDLGEFLGALDALYHRANRRSDRLMSMVVVGHSFGGQAVFDATRERIEANFSTAISKSMPDQGVHAGDWFYPDSVTAAQHPIDSIVRGFGDLVVLINPAIEAERYHRIDCLTRRLKYSPRQQPVMLTVSAENDKARLVFFPIGRFLSKFGSKTQKHSTQKDLMREALGSYEAQITHDLGLRDSTPDSVETARRSIVELPRKAPLPPANSVREERQQREEVGREIANQKRFEYHGKLPAGSSDSTIASIQQQIMLPSLDLKPRSQGRELVVAIPRAAARPGMPSKVMLADKRVIDGHSGFFRQEFIRWLALEVRRIQTVHFEDRKLERRK
ncbi:MAG: hypothetical protein HOP12_12195 [Candidatus Eisenbacteria bacterium]|uniref:Alpha/beta hydrolase n=1 Tax=Eiseniibacteriota bacterium TaxID=2212470 RepID=A0A849SS84_UNCEI|nr:hypothetical protein [Candidatus Eisenbacteria bacterium]